MAFRTLLVLLVRREDLQGQMPRSRRGQGQFLLGPVLPSHPPLTMRAIYK